MLQKKKKICRKLFSGFGAKIRQIFGTKLIFFCSYSKISVSNRSIFSNRENIYGLLGYFVSFNFITWGDDNYVKNLKKKNYFFIIFISHLYQLCSFITRLKYNEVFKKPTLTKLCKYTRSFLILSSKSPALLQFSKTKALSLFISVFFWSIWKLYSSFSKREGIKNNTLENKNKLHSNPRAFQILNQQSVSKKILSKYLSLLPTLYYFRIKLSRLQRRKKINKSLQYSPTLVEKEETKKK